MDQAFRKDVFQKITMNPLEYKLQNLPKDSLRIFINNLVDSNQKLTVEEELQLVYVVVENNIRVDSSFFSTEIEVLHQLLGAREFFEPIDSEAHMKILMQSKLCEIYPQICFSMELNFNEKFPAELYDYLKSHEHNYLNFTDVFLATKLINQIGLNVYQVGFDLSVSSFFNSLYLLKKFNLVDQCPRLMASLYYDIVITVGNHDHETKKLKEHCWESSYSLLNNLKEFEKLKLIQWETNKKNGTKEFPISWIENSNLGKKNKCYLATDVAFEIWDTNPILASKYLEYAIFISSENTCTQFDSVLKNYLALVKAEIGEETEAQKLIDELNSFDKCTHINLLNRRFQNINYQPEVLTLLNPNYDRTELIDSLYLHRALGDELFKDQPDHLGDFYAINAIKIYKYLSELKELKPKYKSLALELMNNTKQREFNRIRKLSEDAEASESDQRLKELLNEIDYFNKPKDYSDPIYPEIFQRALQAHINHSEVVAESSAVTKDYFQYVSSTAVKNQTLNFINSIGVYAGYIYNTKGLQIFEWDQRVVDSLGISLQEKILNKKPYAEEVRGLKKILFESLEIDSTKGVTIIPDGPLAALPFELVLDQELSYDYELKTEESEKIFIDQNQTTLLSYSNEETILKEMQAQEDSMVRVRTAQVVRSDYEELTYGFIECNSINELLDEDPALYAGDQANKENFFKAFNQDLLHVSAHAYTNAESKYDNYIILRNEDSSPKKIYSYEIETHGPSPKVVILSACQTGIGSFTEGVGTYSISRAFITNGSEAVIKTLWKINDLTSKEFMVLLYKHWLKGFSLQEALNLTKSDFKRNNRYTAYDWAGFILEGNGNIYLEQ